MNIIPNRLRNIELPALPSLPPQPTGWANVRALLLPSKLTLVAVALCVGVTQIVAPLAAQAHGYKALVAERRNEVAFLATAIPADKLKPLPLKAHPRPIRKPQIAHKDSIGALISQEGR